jgi:hypothetical protein
VDEIPKTAMYSVVFTGRVGLGKLERRLHVEILDIILLARTQARSRDFRGPG